MINNVCIFDHFDLLCACLHGRKVKPKLFNFMRFLCEVEKSSINNGSHYIYMWFELDWLHLSSMLIQFRLITLTQPQFNIKKISTKP